LMKTRARWSEECWAMLTAVEEKYAKTFSHNFSMIFLSGGIGLGDCSG
jgi:hypothetical protein